MSKTSTLNLPVTINGDGVSLSYAPPGVPITNAAAPVGGPTPQVLSPGDNSISVPTGAQGVLIVPPTSSVIVKKLKGAGGDTGVVISPSLCTMLSLPSGATTLLINAASGETITLLWL